MYFCIFVESGLGWLGGGKGKGHSDYVWRASGGVGFTMRGIPRTSSVGVKRGGTGVGGREAGCCKRLDQQLGASTKHFSTQKTNPHSSTTVFSLVESGTGCERVRMEG